MNSMKDMGTINFYKTKNKIIMTREETKKRIKVMQAFVDGKDVEVLNTDKWELVSNPSWSPATKYRIKPESKYRPFESAQECIEEMRKHEPFGWVKSKDGSTINKFMFIDSLNNDEVTIRTSVRFTYSELVKYYIFADGTPFGVKVKEQL